MTRAQSHTRVHPGSGAGTCLPAEPHGACLKPRDQGLRNCAMSIERRDTAETGVVFLTGASPRSAALQRNSAQSCAQSRAQLIAQNGNQEGSRCASPNSS